MRQEIILPGQGKSYDWAKDHVLVKSTLDLSDGRLTLVEDRLKPGFFLGRHHHKKMIEIFHVLEGSVEFAFDDETITAAPGTTLNVPPDVWHEVRSPGSSTRPQKQADFGGCRAEFQALS